MDFVIAHRFYYTTSSLSLLTGDIGILLSESESSNGQVVYTSETRLAATTESQGTPPADILIQDLDQDSKLDLLLTLPINQKLAVLSGKNYTGSLNCP